MQAVNYNVSGDSSSVKKRTDRQHQFFVKDPISSDGTGRANASTVRLDVGNEWVDPWQSYLRFRLDLENTSFVIIPTVKDYKAVLADGALSLIDSVSLTTADGQEIFQCSEMARLNKFLIPTLFGQDYLDTVGASAMQQDYEDGGLVTIPLPLLAPIFRTDKLLPPYLMNNLRIRIEWSKSSDVFRALDLTFKDADGAERDSINESPQIRYTISKLELQLEQVLLADGLSMAIHQRYLGGKGIYLKMQNLTLSKRTAIAPDIVNQTPIPQAFTRASKVYGMIAYDITGEPRLPAFEKDARLTTLSYQGDHDGDLVPHHTVEDFERCYHHYLAAHSHTKQLNACNAKNLRTKLQNQNFFCIALQRRVGEINKPQLLTDTQIDPVTSGRRVDGTAPFTVRTRFSAVDLEDRLEAQGLTGLLDSAFISTDLLLWTEFESYIVLSPEGNKCVL